MLVNVDPATGAQRAAARSITARTTTPITITGGSYVDIRRTIFMGDYVYAISDKAITAHRVTDLGKVAEQMLPGYTPNDYYWWW